MNTLPPISFAGKSSSSQNKKGRRHFLMEKGTGKTMFQRHQLLLSIPALQAQESHTHQTGQEEPSISYHSLGPSLLFCSQPCPRLPKSGHPHSHSLLLKTKHNPSAAPALVLALSSAVSWTGPLGSDLFPFQMKISRSNKSLGMSQVSPSIESTDTQLMISYPNGPTPGEIKL